MKKIENNLLVIFSIAIFIYLALSNIYNPGLYYDEVLFSNAAFGGDSDLFIYKRIFGIPVMLMSYIGALKSWIYFPIFKYFLVDQFSVRFPMILIGGLTLFLNYKIIKELFGNSAAIIFIILSSVEPSTIFHTKLDWGPTTLMMFFRATSILFLIKYFKSKKIIYLILTFVSLLIGIYDKANFIWIPISLLITVFLLSEFKRITKFIFIIGIIFIFGFAIYFTNEISIPSFEKIHNNIFTLIQVMSGEDVFLVVSGRELAPAIAQKWIVLFCLATSFLFALKNINRDINKKYFYAVLLFFFLITLEILITKQAVGPHHLAILSPFWLIIISIGLDSMSRDKLQIKIFNGTLFASIFILAIIISSLNIDRVYNTDLSSRIKPQWNRVSERLATLANAFPRESKFIFIDWGSSTIFQALTQNSFALYDFWGWFNDGMDTESLKWFKNEFVKKGTYFIVPADGFEIFKSTKENFIKYKNINEWDLKMYNEIYDENGKLAYTIYTL